MLKTLSCTTGWYFTTLPDWPAHEPHAQIAAGLAVVVLVTKVATRYLVYRSPKRYVVARARQHAHVRLGRLCTLACIILYFYFLLINTFKKHYRVVTLLAKSAFSYVAGTPCRPVYSSGWSRRPDSLCSGQYFHKSACTLTWLCR